jgi:hypothetical protein
MLPFSTLLRNALLLFEEKIMLFVAVTAIPLFVSYAIYWLLLNKIINTLATVHSVEQLQAMFSLNSSTTYLSSAAFLVIALINIFGLIANPIVASYNKHITWKTIIPESAKFFFSYIGLTILISLSLFGILIVSYLVCTIIASIFGYINHSYLNTVFFLLIPLVPNVLVLFSGIFFVFAPFALVTNQAGAWAALLTSWRLVKQHFFGIVIRLGLILIILILLTTLLQFIPLVGWSLAILISNITLTVFNYTLYLHLTTNE